MNVQELTRLLGEEVPDLKTPAKVTEEVVLYKNILFSDDSQPVTLVFEVKENYYNVRVVVRYLKDYYRAILKIADRLMADSMFIRMYHPHTTGDDFPEQCCLAIESNNTILSDDNEIILDTVKIMVNIVRDSTMKFFKEIM
jgi:hypothetical protein